MCNLFFKANSQEFSGIYFCMYDCYLGNSSEQSHCSFMRTACAFREKLFSFAIGK